MPFGSYSYSASKTGYYSGSGSGTISLSAQSTTVTIKLTPIPTTGTITVTLDSDSEDDGDDNVWVTADGEVIPLDEETDEEEDNYRIFKAAEITHTSDFIGDTYRFSVTTMAHETDTEGLAMIGMDSGDLYKLAVDITMPGKMTAEGAVITEHTASFTVADLSAEHGLTAESSSTNVSGIVAVSISAVVLIAVLVFVFGRKKQQIL